MTLLYVKMLVNDNNKKKTDPKSLYAYVRSKSKTKIKIGPLVDSSNMQAEDQEQMCEILNQYFSSVFTVERPEGLMELENIVK